MNLALAQNATFLAGQQLAKISFTPLPFVC